MHTPPPPPQNALRLDLHFELRLTPEGPMPSWHADLSGLPPQQAGLRFESLGELIRYLARLDLHAAPPRGIR